MQCKQRRGNMTVSGCMGDKSRCGILKTLQFNAFHDHTLYKQFSGRRRQELPYLSKYYAGDSRLIDKSC